MKQIVTLFVSLIALFAFACGGTEASEQAQQGWSSAVDAGSSCTAVGTKCTTEGDLKISSGCDPLVCHCGYWLSYGSALAQTTCPTTPDKPDASTPVQDASNASDSSTNVDGSVANVCSLAIVLQNTVNRVECQGALVAKGDLHEDSAAAWEGAWDHVCGFTGSSGTCSLQVPQNRSLRFCCAAYENGATRWMCSPQGASLRAGESMASSCGVVTGIVNAMRNGYNCQLN